MKVATRRVRWPLAATGPARGGNWREREAMIVAIEVDGATGLGEAAPLPGMSKDTIDEAERALARFVPGDSPSARFAIETALAVARAQRERTSVARLLGGEHELRPSIVVDDADDAHAAAGEAHRRGRPLPMKIKVGAGPFGDDLARVQRIAAATNAILRIDANRRWPRGETIARLAMLRDALGERLEYVEEPCDATHELLGDDLPCAIALDESLVALGDTDIRAALRTRSLAALVLKPTLLGGFARCLELAALARSHGKLPVVTHALEGAIGRAAVHELARAVGS